MVCSNRFRSNQAGKSTRSWLLALAIVPALFCANASADFDEATKAYLLGQYEKARYEALVAASDGNPKAQMLLGQLYFNGEGVDRDLAHALYWYNKAAESGFADAQFRLGMLYHSGKNGVERNLDSAYKWLTKALENGRQDAKEILEWLYKTEQGNVVNLDENIEVLKQVAASGNQQARYLLSQKMIKGEGMPQDKIGALKMLTEDAQIGFIKAQKTLGEMYYYGNGVEKNYLDAYAWSMAYAGTNELGGIAREGKQIARSALRKLPEEEHNNAYLRSKDYYEKYVLPFHKNAREVGPDKYRIVVHSRAEKEVLAQQRAGKQQQQKQTADNQQAGNAKTSATASPPVSLSESPTIAAPSVVTPATANEVPAATVNASPSVDADKQSDQNTNTKSAINPAQTPNSPESALASSGNTADVVQPAPASTEKGEEQAVASSETESLPAGTNISTPQKASGVLVSEQPATAEVPPAETASSVPAIGPVVSREDMEVIPAVPLETGTEKDGAGAVAPNASERNFEEVYNVLVRKKSGLYELYAREYELDKKLEGRVVFELVIAPDGKVTTVEVISNTLESPTLEQEFVDYLKNNVSFPSASVAEFKITYPVDFLPP